MFFVNQKRHNSNGNAWDSGIIVKETRDEALHQFHAFMSTYAYGQNVALDYIACSVESDDGLIIKNEIDDRRGGEQ